MNDTTPAEPPRSGGATPDPADDHTVERVVAAAEARLAARVAELEAAYERRIAELEGTVAELTVGHHAPGSVRPGGTDRPARRSAGVPRAAAEPPRPDPPDHPVGVTAPEEPAAFDRRRLLSRAGTAAVGAVIGGAAASIAAASPAAAASASFDTSTSTPAVDATTTGSGPAIRATATAPLGSPPPLALDVHGRAKLSGPIGVEGETDDHAAVMVDTDRRTGIMSSGRFHGIHGIAEDGWGVVGDSDHGTGVMGVSWEGVGVIAAGARAQLVLDSLGPAPIPPPEQTVAHGVGEIVFDENADLWLCRAAGTPGTWVKLNSPGVEVAAFTVLPNPVRVYDSRPDAAPTDVGPKTPLSAATSRSIDLTRSSSGVPLDATAAVVTVTVTNTTGGSPSGPSFLALHRDGTAWPGTSTLNWTAPGTTIATTTVVPLGPGAKLAAYAASRTDVVIDVVGYYR